MDLGIGPDITQTLQDLLTVYTLTIPAYHAFNTYVYRNCHDLHILRSQGEGINGYGMIGVASYQVGPLNQRYL